MLVALLLAAFFVGALAIWSLRSRPSQDGPAPSPPRQPRVVALSPAITVTMDWLEQSRLLVGRHAFDHHADPAIAICGDEAGIDYESLLRARPTHVLLQRSARELPPRLLSLAQQHGWQLRVYPLLELGDIERLADALDELLSPAPSSPPPSQRLRDHWTHDPADLASIGPVLLVSNLDPISVLGPGSWHDQLLQSLGAVSAISQGPPFLELSLEDVIRLQPAGIIAILPRPMGSARGGSQAHDSPPRSAAELLGVLARPSIPAFATGRVAIIDHPLALTPSSAMADVADEMRAILRAWASEPVP